MNTYSMAYVVKAHSSNGLPAGTIICYNLSMNNDILKSVKKTNEEATLSESKNKIAEVRENKA